jgi:hypothetical protein
MTILKIGALYEIKKYEGTNFSGTKICRVRGIKSFYAEEQMIIHMGTKVNFAKNQIVELILNTV